MNNLQSISYFLPELAIVVLALSSIVLDLFSLKKWIKSITIIGLVIVSVLLLQTPVSGEYIFEGLLINDSFSYFFKWIILISTFSIILISNYSKELDYEYYSEYNSLLLIILLGMFLMTNSVNLLMIYLSVELVSIPSYILAGILKNDKKSNEASLKYVIFGSFASGLMLFGLSWLYGISGSTNIYEIHNTLMTVDNPNMLFMSIMLILIGFGYKISMAPLHYWTPDVYEGSPTTITAFLSVAPKAAGFAILIRSFFVLFTNESSIAMTSSALKLANWPLIISVLSAATMSIGNLLALKQNNVKRMLAYSTISHVGFMLMAFSTLSVDASIGIMFYMTMYMFMNLSAFFMVIYVENNYNVKTIDGWAGIGHKNLILASFMVISLVSLAGLPPTSGFVAKVYLFRTLFAEQKFYWLAIVGIINSVVSLYYYFKIVKSMFFMEDDKIESKSAHPVVYWLIVIFSAQNLIFYFYWNNLYALIEGFVK
tara:strand:+ start:37 stop:1488 length:1452 start_codon:yes stop_codon:yes gene_type:complete